MTAAHDLASKVLELEAELDIPALDPTQYYTDSQDVLSWIQNPSVQLKRCVGSRCEFIHNP